MQICADELKKIMSNVLSKREFTGEFKFINTVCVTCGLIVPNCLFSTDNEIKAEGFSLETCRSMIALMDVSFQLVKAGGMSTD